MTLEELLQKAKSNIEKGYVKKMHHEAKKLRKLYLQITTGEDIESLLPKFELRESPELYKQRVALTNQNLTEVSNPICNRFYGVSRVEPVEKRYEAEKAKQQPLIELAESQFCDGGNAEKYLEQLDKLAIYDPNAWILTDFVFDAAGLPFCFPVIVESDAAIDWAFDQKGECQYLMSLYTDKTKTGGGIIETISDYTIYGRDYTILFLEKSIERKLETPTEIFSTGNRTFYVYVRSINPDQVPVSPARRVGYIHHESKKGLLVSPIHKAVSVFKDLIRDKSEYDVSKRSHVFPQKVMYDDICMGEVHIDPSRKCFNGLIVGTNDTCSVCQGSGFKPHRSGQEIIRIQKPRHKEEFIPVDQLISYVTTDLKAVEMLGNDIRLATQRAEAAIFSTGALQKTSGVGVKDVKQTATEIQISNDEYNYVLDGWAKNRANLYKFIIDGIGRAYDTKMTTVFAYNGLYVKETIQEMLGRYESLKNANASAELIEDAEYRIAKSFFESDPDSFKEYLTKKAFQPFSGMTSGQIAAALMSEYVPERNKILHLNFSYIFEQIYQLEGEGFYQKQYAEQKPIVDRYVDEILSQVQAQRATLITPASRR